MLYKTLCLPVLSFGFAIWSPTSTETLMMDRSQNKILCTILGLPVHSPMSGVHLLCGTLSIQAIQTSCQLSFIRTTLSLPDTAIAKIILLYRASSPNPPPSSVVLKFSSSLESLFLPSISELHLNLQSSIKTGVEGINQNYYP